jgi:hypothetical protein
MSRIDSTGKKTRKINVTLPDGTVATRRSPREYVAAVVALGPDYKNRSYDGWARPVKWQVIGWSVSHDNAASRAKTTRRMTWTRISATPYPGEKELGVKTGDPMFDEVHVVSTDIWLNEDDGVYAAATQEQDGE